jgi:glycosyltransferase involved in cell wall biosynthesis
LLARHTRQPVVIHDGLTRDREDLSRDQAAAEVERRHGISGRFVLCVADLYPYKNLEALVHGFALMPKTVRDGCRLVLVGRPIVEEYASTVVEAARQTGLGDDLAIIHGVPHEDLEAFYLAAAVYAFPSLVEAGGTTLVEAMAAGLPIVASSVAPMPEFCGDAALYCDPYQPGAWASALATALTDGEVVQRLGARGRARAAAFRWEDAARATLATFE